jgi:hypothetical protein
MQGALDRRDARLELPAVEVRAIIGNSDFDVPHRPERLSHAIEKAPQMNADKGGPTLEGNDLGIIYMFRMLLKQSPR